MRQLLDSWKAIAVYLGRSVRTARRWEAEEGLPVHRHMHQAQGSVYAYAAELDAWQQTRQAARGTGTGPALQAASDAFPPTAEPSIAVLPLAWLGPGAESAYIADGFTEEVINALSHVGGLRVISRTSTMALRGVALDARELGRKLGVRYLLEGSVRHAGERLRVTARLVDAASGQGRWTETHDGTLEDILGLQTRIARAIADAMAVGVDASPRDQPAPLPPLPAAAWICLVRARQHSLRWRRDALDAAVALLQQSLTESPEHPLLLATLGRVHLHYRESGLDASEAPLRAAAQCASRISARWSKAPMALQLRGWIEYSSGRVQSAVPWLRLALEGDPQDPDLLGLLANCHLLSGRVAQARGLIDRLLAVDPLTPLTRCMPGWADLLDGKLGNAIRPYRDMLAMDPGNPMARLFLTWVLVLDDRADEALAVVDATEAELRHTPPIELATLLVRAAHGDAGVASVTLSPQLEQLSGASEMFPRFLAHAFALAGAQERATFWLARAADLGFINYPFIAHHDPVLRRLQGYAPFDALLVDIEQRWARLPDIDIPGIPQHIVQRGNDRQP